jgi:regulator of protease activity HflC (stomatin/prohibitin superfamily)
MADLDAEKAALEMQNYRTAISSAAQTALRDIIGRNGAHRPAARP